MNFAFTGRAGAIMVVVAITAAACSQEQAPSGSPSAADADNVLMTDPMPISASSKPVRAVGRSFPIESLFPEPLHTLKYNVRVSGTVPLLKQKTEMGCWATAASILYCWRENKAMQVEDVLALVSPVYERMYRDDRGLPPHYKQPFFSTLGLTFEYGASYHPSGLQELLQRYGPLWFTINTDGLFSRHATVVIGLFGTEDIDQTYVLYIDPLDGNEHAMTYGKFMTMYESVAFEENAEAKTLGNERFPYTFQVIHFP